MLSFIDNFPVLVAFDNLDMLENLEMAKKALDGLSGIYGFVHTPTGTCYIGSSQNLGLRIMDHIQNHSSNLHLQSAILKYGLSSFVFVILQYCIPSDMLKREQHYLDILFSLPVHLRYNFNPTASSMLGYKHTEETLAKMSEAQTGANNPMFGKFGITPTNALTVNVNTLDNQLVREFSSQVACAKWLGVSEGSVRNYIRSGKVFKGLYLLSNS